MIHFSTWELTYIEESLEKSDNVSVQPFDLKEDEGGFSLEGEIAGCLWCFTEDDLLVTYVRSPHTPEDPHRCEISKASRPSTIEAALRVILHRDQQGLERLQGFLPMRQRKGLLKTTTEKGPNEGPCNLIQQRKYLRCFFDTALARLDHQVTIRVTDYIDAKWNKSIWPIMTRIAKQKKDRDLM